MKYLIFAGSGIGDFILTLPVAKSIKLYDKVAFIKLICTSNKDRFKINESLLGVQHYIDEIDYYSAEEKIHSLGMLFRLGYKSYDYGFVIQYTDNQNTSTIPCRIINFAAKFSVGKRIFSKPQIKYDRFIEKLDGLRQLDYYLKILGEVGIPVSKDYTDLIDSSILRNTSSQFNYDKKRKCISLVIGTAKVSMTVGNKKISNTPKSWSIKKWFGLSEKLTSLGYNVFLLGGKTEAIEIEKEGLKSFPSHVYMMAGKLTIEESLSILDLSKIVIGCDTGLMHCAGALGKTTLTLFGCTDYHEYLPFGEKSEYITMMEACSPCFGTENAVLCEHKKCMNNISVEMVLNRIKELNE